MEDYSQRLEDIQATRNHITTLEEAKTANKKVAEQLMAEIFAPFFNHIKGIGRFAYSIELNYIYFYAKDIDLHSDFAHIHFHVYRKTIHFNHSLYSDDRNLEIVPMCGEIVKVINERKEEMMKLHSSMLSHFNSSLRAQEATIDSEYHKLKLLINQLAYDTMLFTGQKGVFFTLPERTEFEYLLNESIKIQALRIKRLSESGKTAFIQYKHDIIDGNTHEMSCKSGYVTGFIKKNYKKIIW